jgi:energy-coupling factor transport system permease protein
MIVASLLFLVGASKIPRRSIRALVIIVLPIVIIFSVVWPFSLGQGEVLATYSIFGYVLRVTNLGIEWGLIQASRLAVLILSTFLVLATTSEGDLVAGFLKLRVPYILAFGIMLTLRFVNVVAGDISIIQDARKARALPRRAGLVTYVRNIISLLVPLLLVVVRRMQLVTNALDVRAFVPGKKRSNYHSLVFRRLDLALLVLMAATVSIALYFRLFQGMFVLIPGRI